MDYLVVLANEAEQPPYATQARANGRAYKTTENLVPISKLIYSSRYIIANISPSHKIQYILFIRNDDRFILFNISELSEIIFFSLFANCQRYDVEKLITE